MKGAQYGDDIFEILVLEEVKLADDRLDTRPFLLLEHGAAAGGHVDR